MSFAPETPTTKELHEMFEFTPEMHERIDYHRNLVNRALTGRGFVDAQGPCALTGQHELIDATLERMCAWKPRSKPYDWHGMETTDPVGAFMRIHEQARLRGNAAMELGCLEHVIRYGSRLALGWFGARLDNIDQKLEIATFDTNLPLGDKNALSGDITPALADIERLRDIRGAAAAPVFLIFRGGEMAQTPDEWEKLYIEAYNATDGLMMVDSAHGGEMAHDPTGEFGKSEIGQELCLKHIAELAISGYAPAMVLSEVSTLKSPIDPPVKPWRAKPHFTAIKRSRLRQITPKFRATDSTYFV